MGKTFNFLIPSFLEHNCDNYSAEPFRWNEFPNNLYIFYIHFITGLQAGLVPAILILKKMNITFIKEMVYEIYE